MARMAVEGVYLEDLRFQAQQAAEKAVKAVLIKLCIEFPYTHDISQLLTILENAGQEIPEFVQEAERLSRFAVIVRYPGIAPPVDGEEYNRAIATADRVVRWAVEFISA
jgi:HEPN domain-containing protein